MLEQHAVPQNVTTFQFRLIGDMTIKQFGYLAGGAILAYISYNAPLPFFFRYPLTGIFALGGIGFAFVPIEERPMDVWFLSFIRSIYSPTQYLWQREAPAPAPAQNAVSGAKQATTVPSVNPWAAMFDFSFLLKLVKPPTTQKAVNTAVMASTPIPSVSGTTATAPVPVPAPTASTTENPQLTTDNTQPTPDPVPPKEEDKKITMEQQMKQMQEQLNGVLNERERLMKELETVKGKMAQQQTQQPISSAPIKQNPPANEPPVVQRFIPVNQKSSGLPTITTTPNVVTGIVRERTGNLLVSILVTVKDKDEIPVRALKTNKLGQFAASTPLTPGTYTIEVEDPKGQFFFEQTRVILDGSVLPAIEIIAKTQQEIDRAKLEQSLFGKQNM